MTSHKDLMWSGYVTESILKAKSGTSGSSTNDEVRLHVQALISVVGVASWSVGDDGSQVPPERNAHCRSLYKVIAAYFRSEVVNKVRNFGVHSSVGLVHGVQSADYCLTVSMSSSSSHADSLFGFGLILNDWGVLRLGVFLRCRLIFRFFRFRILLDRSLVALEIALEVEEVA